MKEEEQPMQDTLKGRGGSIIIKPNKTTFIIDEELQIGLQPWSSG